MTTTATRPLSVYRLMDDKVLAFTIADLERMVEQLKFARSPVASKLRDGYADALDAARAELERRQA